MPWKYNNLHCCDHGLKSPGINQEIMFDPELVQYLGGSQGGFVTSWSLSDTAALRHFVV